jgi:L-amino acid N-acyltransferase YncA
MIKFIFCCLAVFSMNLSSAEVVCRSLKSTDWEKFRALRLSALKECPKAYGITVDDEVKFEDSYWQHLCNQAEAGEGKWFQVAESKEGELIGMIGAIEHDGTLMRHQVEIVQAYVSPSYRRHHVMERLFIAMQNELKKVPHLEQMIAWVTLHETQVSREMLMKFGFVYAGQLSKSVKYHEQYYDCCWLEAPLIK